MKNQGLTPRSIKRLYLIAAFCLALPGAASAIDVVVGGGDDPCPAGYVLLSAGEAQANQTAVCNAMSYWDIARLAGGGSMDGAGYGCGIRTSDTRVLGSSLCRPAPAPSSIISWNGSCAPSQVGANGSVTITKTPNGSGFAVTLEGTLTISSPTYGYTRHGLPAGFLPVSTSPTAYTCSVQQRAGYGDTSGIANYGGQGVHIRNDSSASYVGKATLWFPEKFYNGQYTLRCTWVTNEATNPLAWQSCPGITVLQ